MTRVAPQSLYEAGYRWTGACQCDENDWDLRTWGLPGKDGGHSVHCVICGWWECEHKSSRHTSDGLWTASHPKTPEPRGCPCCEEIATRDCTPAVSSATGLPTGETAGKSVQAKYVGSSDGVLPLRASGSPLRPTGGSPPRPSGVGGLILWGRRGNSSNGRGILPNEALNQAVSVPGDAGADVEGSSLRPPPCNHRRTFVVGRLAMGLKGNHSRKNTHGQTGRRLQRRLRALERDTSSLGQRRAANQAGSPSANKLTHYRTVVSLTPGPGETPGSDTITVGDAHSAPPTRDLRFLWGRRGGTSVVPRRTPASGRTPLRPPWGRTYTCGAFVPRAPAGRGHPPRGCGRRRSWVGVCVMAEVSEALMVRCAKCGEPTDPPYRCEHCGKDHCENCTNEYEGMGFCYACFPYGATIQWDDTKPGWGEVRKGACLHYLGCRMLNHCGGAGVPAYDYQWVAESRGKEMLASGCLKPCKVCGTGEAAGIQGDTRPTDGQVGS